MVIEPTWQWYGPRGYLEVGSRILVDYRYMLSCDWQIAVNFGWRDYGGYVYGFKIKTLKYDKEKSL